jgi:hypothetical protein
VHGRSIRGFGSLLFLFTVADSQQRFPEDANGLPKCVANESSPSFATNLRPCREKDKESRVGPVARYTRRLGNMPIYGCLVMAMMVKTGIRFFPETSSGP